MLKCGDGTEGWDEYAPFDAILVAAGGGKAPAAWLHQLREGGVLVMPVGRQGEHVLVRFRKLGGEWSEEYFDACTFVPLVHG